MSGRSVYEHTLEHENEDLNRRRRDRRITVLEQVAVYLFCMYYVNEVCVKGR